MTNVRVIPVLLLKGQGLVKTIKFKKPTYVGDPINAIKIFNQKEVDELFLLDITAARTGQGPAFKVIEEIATECFMPLGYGGGIRTIDDIARILYSGVEKVSLNAMALQDLNFVREAAKRFGSQAIVVSIDAKKRIFGGYEVYGENGVTATGRGPVAFAKEAVAAGAGEILLNSIDRDGLQTGYDLTLTRLVADAVNVPVIACGGAGKLQDFRDAIAEGHASAVGAGSMFVFHGRHRAVLISYPSPEEIQSMRPKDFGSVDMGTNL